MGRKRDILVHTQGLLMYADCSCRADIRGGIAKMFLFSGAPDQIGLDDCEWLAGVTASSSSGPDQAKARRRAG